MHDLFADLADGFILLKVKTVTDSHRHPEADNHEGLDMYLLR